MIRTYILEYAPVAFVILFIVYALIKVRIIRRKKLDRGYWDLFINTIVPVNKQTIKNTFQEKLKQYYKQSNKVNYVFYVLFFVVGLLYFMMWSIV
ncbi:MAG: hypothetical protein BGO70_18305 [Bacteroidetes bacterium 43-93]|nr:MAG: hypothetical protein BGO70_18305 [Bacteroidetes bacterium 43-93]